jgi:three-Cys-motif partner protein
VVQSDDHFVEYEPHSRYKHLILKTYFEAWGRKLLLRPRAPDTVCYVDACAGRGSDEAGNPGSPLIAAQAAAEAEAQLTVMRGRPVHVRVIAIEKRKDYYRQLKSCLAPFGHLAQVRHGTLADYLDDVERTYANAPTLYFIDPFGLEPLKAELVQRALAPRYNEILLLFSDQAALRHFGVVQSTGTAALRALRRHEEQSWLFPEQHEEERRALSTRAESAELSLEQTRERSQEILDAAFGGNHWQPILQATPRGLRRERFLELYLDFLQQAAPLTLKIPVMNADGAHVYFLLYATKSRKGFRAMKESVDFALRTGPLMPDVSETLQSLLSCDITQVADFVKRRFAGQSVRWAPDRLNQTAPSIRAAALEETDVFPFQLSELEEKLQDVRQPGRIKRYAFPPTAPPSHSV